MNHVLTGHLQTEKETLTQTDSRAGKTSRISRQFANAANRAGHPSWKNRQEKKYKRNRNSGKQSYGASATTVS
jgi:hypothetical protein